MVYGALSIKLNYSFCISTKECVHVVMGQSALSDIVTLCDCISLVYYFITLSFPVYMWHILCP